jgi:hypothetical protein
VSKHPQVVEALTLLEERFMDIERDGPNAYAAFLTTLGDGEERARLRQEAAATVREFLRGFREGT